MLFEATASVLVVLSLGAIFTVPFVTDRMETRRLKRESNRRALIARTHEVINQDRYQRKDPRAKAPSLGALVLDLMFELGIGCLSLITNRS